MDIILQAGRCAPSAWDAQSCSYVVISDRAVIHRLAQITAKHLGGEIGDHHFFGAVNLILLYGERGYFDLHYDTGTAVQNMFIAASGLGIGSVWVNQLITITEEPDVIELLEELGIPSTHYVSAIAVFGYAAEKPIMSERTSKVRYIREEGN